MSSQVEALARRGVVVGVGDRVLDAVDGFGSFLLLCARTLRAAVRGRFPLHETLVQFRAVAIRSTVIVGITALFTGMVLALQTVMSLTRFGAKPYTGSFVGLALALELGPVLTALMAMELLVGSAHDPRHSRIGFSR